MSEENANTKPTADIKPFPKPVNSFSARFKSKNAPSISGVATLLSALPIIKIGDVGDWTRLHPTVEEYWSDELCFVSVPVKGVNKPQLQIINDDLAVQYLSSKQIIRQRLALGAKPHDIFFLCLVPSRNMDNPWNATAFEACEKATTHWIQALSRKKEGVDGYLTKFSHDVNAFDEPNWPARTFDELLEATLKGFHIEDEKHPGLVRLIGGKQNLK
jgi:hypothetical protein